MRNSMIYRLLLIVMLLLLPISGAAQQTNDITKPTRTRVTDKNKKGDQQQNAKSKDVKNNAKNTDSKATRPLIRKPRTPKLPRKRRISQPTTSRLRNL